MLFCKRLNIEIFTHVQQKRYYPHIGVFEFLYDLMCHHFCPSYSQHIIQSPTCHHEITKSTAVKYKTPSFKTYDYQAPTSID